MWLFFTFASLLFMDNWLLVIYCWWIKQFLPFLIRFFFFSKMVQSTFSNAFLLGLEWQQSWKKLYIPNFFIQWNTSHWQHLFWWLYHYPWKDIVLFIPQWSFDRYNVAHIISSSAGYELKFWYSIIYAGIISILFHLHISIYKVKFKSFPSGNNGGLLS